MFKFVHDEANKIVYRYPTEPAVEETTGRGSRKRIGWSVHMEMSITRADNRLHGNQWEKPTSVLIRQSFDANHTRDQVISYFHMHHAPDGIEISEEAYVSLQAAYEAEASGSLGNGVGE
jgi:hypothetical protein